MEAREVSGLNQKASTVKVLAGCIYMYPYSTFVIALTFSTSFWKYNNSIMGFYVLKISHLNIQPVLQGS